MEQDQLHIPISERLKAIPGFFGIHLHEKPHYQVMLKDDFRKCNIEIRAYDPMLVVSTAMFGLHQQAREEAFKKLAAYIFDHDIAMTSPVLQTQRLSEGQNFSMSFILPSKILAQEAPQPDDSSLHIETIPAQTWAVSQFSGRYDLNEMDARRHILQDWLKIRGQKEDQQSLRIAQYDGPATIPFLCRNEVQILLWSRKLNS